MEENNEISTQDMSIDSLIVNLKILALIKKYEKLSVKEDDQSLTIDGKHNFLYIQSIKRWINHDNRQKTTDYIENIINKTFEWMDKIYENYKNYPSESKESIDQDVFEEDYESLLIRLSKELINASEGLKNLRLTYEKDSLINSQLQLLLDKIKIKVEKINQTLNVKWLDK